MTIKKQAILSIAISLLGVLSNTSSSTCAESTVLDYSDPVLTVEDYEEILEPYQKVIDSFNLNYGTTYGFLTDEQMLLQNIDKLSYLQNVAEEYSKMTEDEFAEVLKNAYYNDDSYSYKNTPYNQIEAESNQIQTYSCPNPSPNGNNVFVLE